jgi:hypothetical protein
MVAFVLQIRKEGIIKKNCAQQFVLAQEIHESRLKIRKRALPEIYELFSALTENC